MWLRLQVWGVEVRFSFWFFAVVALFLQMGKEVLAFYLLLPVLVHECGHFLMMAACGVSVEEIAFTPVSVDICRGNNPVGDGRELLVMLGGIAANLLMALWLYLFAFQSMRTMFLIAANMAVAVFNLLPIGNLDGGEICKLLCRRFFHPRLAFQLSRAVSFFTLAPLFAFSIFLVLRGVGNITLLLACGYLAATVILRE